MLVDTARKLLRIMYHFYGHFRRMPTLRELARLSGRTPGSILLGCQELLREGYIEWQPLIGT
ncbi:helix-turn-helix domain-containing protein [Paenibacillus albidus]|uniref:helix-turn-helix domain-containing protein n=1 Tax=Paenibacillus albidus TaxID=2041023 RepID=UPI001BEBA21E|nr:helix-turn-helix domain-containing protein [Paenibacillus albidus]MBT2293437.1 helix-turn-helix domain-containing protein [Paenibacillus albidus]